MQCNFVKNSTKFIIVYISHTKLGQFLPPANEVWGKVMFLHLCVILFTGEGVASQYASQVTWPGWGLHPGGSASGGSASRGGWADPPPRYMGYYGIQSTSGRYASYWNAFLFLYDSSYVRCQHDFGEWAFCGRSEWSFFRRISAIYKWQLPAGTQTHGTSKWN